MSKLIKIPHFDKYGDFQFPSEQDWKDIGRYWHAVEHHYEGYQQVMNALPGYVVDDILKKIAPEKKDRRITPERTHQIIEYLVRCYLIHTGLQKPEYRINEQHGYPEAPFVVYAPTETGTQGEQK